MKFTDEKRKQRVLFVCFQIKTSMLVPMVHIFTWKAVHYLSSYSSIEAFLNAWISHLHLSMITVFLCCLCRRRFGKQPCCFQECDGGRVGNVPCGHAVCYHSLHSIFLHKVKLYVFRLNLMNADVYLQLKIWFVWFIIIKRC